MHDQRETGQTVVIDEHALAAVLAEIAETTAETLELQEVFERIAKAVRRLIPLDSMGVVRMVPGERVVLHAISVLRAPDPNRLTLPIPFICSTVECAEPMPLGSWSPRLRPRLGPIKRIDDAEIELDPSFPFDKRAIDKGVRSILWAPLRTVASAGGVWLNSYQPNAFDDGHEEILRPIAALLGSAVEHWRIWDVERRRRERLDKIETLLGTFAESLDVREIFQRLSDGMQPVLAHDLMTLTELDLGTRSIRVAAFAGTEDCAVPTHAVTLTEEELEHRTDFDIVHDIQKTLDPATERGRLILGSGMRSWLRVPLWSSGRMKGSLSFLHRETCRYNEDDAEVARRLADRIGLTISLRRLSEEARIAAEARERAERLEATVETLSSELESRGSGRIVGVSRSWKEALTQVARVAPSETTVLITGESGTGKEIIARLLRHGSSRAGKPFVAVNCAALPEPLLESELFGHERGAFTGAVAKKIGRLEQAAGGTLFLDEIAEMSPPLQAKLLRVLQEREFQRVGGTQVLRTDVRVLAATNRDLATAIEDGKFREDLFYRLNVFGIHLPPLRDRVDDILPLAEAFLEELGRSMGRPVAGIAPDAVERLRAHAWPGNVRELRNAIERAILLCDGGKLRAEHLPPALARKDPPASAAIVLPVALLPPAASPAPQPSAEPAESVNLESVERRLIERAMREANGNKAKAARELGLSRAQLYTRIEKYGLDAELGRSRPRSGDEIDR